MQQGAIPEIGHVDAATFHSEIVPQHRPVVLRGVVKDPAVCAQLEEMLGVHAPE